MGLNPKKVELEDRIKRKIIMQMRHSGTKGDVVTFKWRDYSISCEDREEGTWIDQIYWMDPFDGREYYCYVEEYLKKYRDEPKRR